MSRKFNILEDFYCRERERDESEGNVREFFADTFKQSKYIK